MLQTFREYSGSIFVKILFGVLVASFALWGVGDVFRSYTTMRPVASVGDASISQEEFHNFYRRAVTNLQNSAKGKLTPEILNGMQLPQRILDDLINNAVMQNQIKSLGLQVSDTVIRDSIQSTPAFQNSKGEFDKRQFDYLISNNGLTEAGFLNQTRNNLLKVQLIGGLSYGIGLPKFYVETLFRGLEEKRVFTVVQIPLSTIKVSETPSDGDLEQLYKDNQQAFMRPELRNVSLLILDPKIQQSKITVSDEQLQQEYEKRKSELADPEKRDVVQLTFTHKGDAEKALNALKEGADAERLSSSMNGNFKKFQDAGRQQFSDLHSDVIFGLNAGDYSEPQDSALGWSVFGVKKIIPAHEKSFSEVKAKLEEDLKIQILNDKLYDLKNKIEDAVAGGTPLAEVAKEHALTVQVLEPITKSGVSAEGKSVLPAEYKELILENAFTLVEGSDSPLIDAPNGTSIIIHVDKVMPEAVPAFAEIKELVTKAWKESKQQEQAAKLAQTIAKDVKSLEDLTAQAKKNGLVTKVLPAMSRSDVEGMKKPEQEIQPSAINQGFALAKNQAGYAVNGNGFVVLMVNKEVPLDLSKEKEKLQKFTESVNLMVNKDFTGIYLNQQRVAQKVSINQSILDTLINSSN